MEALQYLDELNDQQRTAATISEGYLRVIAGAGSGKTKLLVSRYAYLVEMIGIDPSNILCVTFTNKAAGEMRSRIRNLIGDGYDTSLIATYHGFCARLLREDSEKFEFPKNFTILDETAQKSILTQIYESMELKLDHASFERMLGRIGMVKDKMDYIKGILTPGNCQILPSIATRDDEIIEQYLQKQKAVFALDFDDLINFALYVLEKYESVREKWQEKLNYIQVDEFQDSAKKEMMLIDILSGFHGNVMIVGDPDQNIYEWRGSDVKLLVDFDKTHVPTETVFLTRNYRSTPQILKCANTLIDYNKYRLKKDLYTDAPAGMPVVHIHTKTYAEEMKAVGDKIEELTKKEGAHFSDIAILYRSTFLSRGVENVLVQRNIPYEIVGGVSFYQRMEIRDATAYLRLVASDDDMALERVINTPRRRFGRAKLARLKQIAESNRCSLFAALCDNRKDNVLGNSGAEEFISVILNARQGLGKKKIAEITDEVLSRSGYEAYIRELGDMERFENLAEFKRIAHDFEKDAGENVSLQDFLNYISLQTSHDGENKEERVKLMTIHASKGLEFPYVLVVGMTDGIMPSSRAVEERKLLGLEEERRLCYVAITRAMKGLFFTESESGSGSSAGVPSRFLYEMGEENYVRIGSISKEIEKLFKKRYRVAGENAEMPAGQSPADLCGFGVLHPVFGFGVAETYNEKNDTYAVRFSKLKTQRNMAREFLAKCGLMAPGSDEFIQAASAAANTENAAPIEAAVTMLTAAAAPTEAAVTMPTAAAAPTEAPVVPAETEPSPVLEQAQTAEEETAEPETESTSAGEEPDMASPQEDAETNEVPDPFSEAPKPKKRKTRESAGEEAFTKIPAVLTDDPSETNLWKRSDVPHEGWQCTGITDLGSPCGICEMCGKQIIRYAHHMRHPAYRKSITAGCVCAGNMEGDLEAARARERDLKNLGARRENFLKRKWKVSRNGNEYLKIDEHLIVLVKSAKNGRWSYSFDGVFSQESFETREGALLSVFNRLAKK